MLFIDKRKWVMECRVSVWFQLGLVEIVEPIFFFYELHLHFVGTTVKVETIALQDGETGLATIRWAV
ncbi:MAG: hypothetical protein AAGI23_16445 [Bacteroidota bacterium]